MKADNKPPTDAACVIASEVSLQPRAQRGGTQSSPPDHATGSGSPRPCGARDDGSDKRSRRFRIAVIVTTYNRPDALALVLDGFLAQSDRDFELLVADDGSTSDTAELVSAYQARAPFKLTHVWQEDLGFRAAAARNRAIAATDADYIVFTDGDCVPPVGFVAAQRELAEPGWFLSGNRMLLSESFTQRVIQDQTPIYRWSKAQLLHAVLRGDLNRWLPLLHLPDWDWLRKRTPQRWQGAKTCNLAVWRADLLRVNGLDESYTGWGLEDSDLVIRLLRAGVQHKSGRFAVPVFHLWHRENDRSRLEENQRKLDALLSADHVRAKLGLDQYGALAPSPLAGGGNLLPSGQPRLKILHIARRYGPVGGMERYVWEVTRELAALGHSVEVICERCHAEPPPGIAVHKLGEIAARPRWLALLRFGRHVARWLHDNPHPDSVIHSHERLDLHDVTTFHGPPFATVRDKPWWKKLSLRIAMQLWLERRELRVARAIVPNSAIISRMLAHYYPEYAHKLTAPVEPGVVAGPLREFRAIDPQGGVIGFVGKEWQRKGLPLIADVVAELHRTRPNLELWVVGPSPDEVEPLFAGWHGGYRLLGWRSDNEYLKDFDVLLHPARAEPYGMVIAEAMAARVPVVVSDVCGAAASVGAESGAVLPLSAPVTDWVAAVETQLRCAEAPPRFDRDWRAVAVEYETIYKGCI